MFGDLERIGEEAVIVCLRYYPLICLERLREKKKTQSG
jgi:hypothetical protein